MIEEMKKEIAHHIVDILKAVLGAAIAAAMAELIKQLSGLHFSGSDIVASLIGAYTGLKIKFG